MLLLIATVIFFNSLFIVIECILVGGTESEPNDYRQQVKYLIVDKGWPGRQLSVCPGSHHEMQC